MRNLINLLPIISYLIATIIMYKLSLTHDNKQYNKYTGWSRLQILFCSPFLLIKNHDISKIATDLIWYNSFGCALSVHIFYILSKYEAFNILTSRSLSKFKIYSKINAKYKILLQILSDLFVHFTPIFISYLYLDTSQPYKYKEYLWLLPAIIHLIYPYILIRSWRVEKLYEININYSIFIYLIGWLSIFIGYYVISINIL